MRAFAQLFTTLDQTTRTSEKVAALEGYFRAAPPEDAAWALWFLSGQRLKRVVKTAQLREWAAEAANLPLWMVEECYGVVGDLAETLALLLPPPTHVDPPSLSRLVRDRLQPLAGASPGTQRALLRRTWDELDPQQRFLWHKLITGGFRVGVSRGLLVRALANVAAVEPAVMTHRLMGAWQPTAKAFDQLISGEQSANDDAARPYPFYLASPLEGGVELLGDVGDWQCEWKWDGIRAQLIRRGGECVLWSRGEEILTESFPEIAEAAITLPDGTVLDGELLAWQGDAPLPFARLQRRLHRRVATTAVRREVPVVFMAYDLLEADGCDWRSKSLNLRRAELERVVSLAKRIAADRPALAHASELMQADLFEVEPWAQATRESRDGPATLESQWPAQTEQQQRTGALQDAGANAHTPLRISPLLAAESWDAVRRLQEEARAAGAEGLMLKRPDSEYGTGRQRGAWWKWKVAPFTCDAVLVAAQPGHGRRATLFTDYTFAMWQGDQLVPVAKAYSGLTDDEIREVDRFVRQNTTGRFGPVRSVNPELVFELAFEGIAPSSRHKSGLALRFPRISRRRYDRKPAEADTIELLRALAVAAGGG
jgi:DNA ligase-1